MTDTADGRSFARKRTLQMTVPSLFLLLRALSERGARSAGVDNIPAGAAIAGEPRWDPDRQIIEVDIFHNHWPRDLADEIAFLWAPLLPNGDYGTHVALNLPPAPPRGPTRETNPKGPRHGTQND